MQVNIILAMTIPLDRLYQYIERQAQKIWQDHVLIYRFYPHGSKDFHDLSFLTDNYTLDDLVLCPYVYCNDQELLDWEQYQTATNQTALIESFSQQLGLPKQNLRDYPIDIWDWALLLHSEQGGYNLAQYESNGFVGVYYWSHAVIARDWFRYAQHVQQSKQVQQTFLIYNRAWAGTREYRLRFADLLVEQNLQDHSRTTVNVCDPELGIHYTQYKFHNSKWQPTRPLENYFLPTKINSQMSADFDLADYESTDLEVVLETVFDNDRVHLTEKTLRPIALGQPFILVSMPGSIKYLQQYGFETFDSVWSEQYDHIADSADRLQSIVRLMKSIADWTPDVRQQRMAQAQAIADRNRIRFFSKEFEQQVLTELDTNLKKAFDYLRLNNTSQRWLQWYHSMRDLSVDQLEHIKQSQVAQGSTNHFVNCFTPEHWQRFYLQAHAKVSKD